MSQRSTCSATRSPASASRASTMAWTPPLVQQAAIGHLMRQGMLEGVFLLGKRRLGRLEVGEVAV